MNRSSISNPPPSFPTLLPCPFCGGEGKLTVRGKTAGIQCRGKTHLIWAYATTAFEAAANWNTRASPQLQSSEAVERVARAIEEALCKDGERSVGAIWDDERGRGQMFVAARAAITALTSPAVVEDHCGWVETNPEDFDLSKQDKDENSG